MGTVPIPQGATIGEPERNTVPIPQGATIGEHADDHSGFWNALKDDLVGAAKSLPSMLPPVAAYQSVRKAIDEVKSLKDTGQTTEGRADDQRKQAGYGVGYRVAAKVGEGLGVNVSGMEDAAAKGDTAGVLGHAALPIALAVSPIIAEGAKAVAGAVSPRGVMASRMAEVPPGEQFSRGEVMDAARAKGVNLDLAQATDSGVAKAVKKANQYSLTGQGSYEANAAKNTAALEEWANSEAAKYSPEPGSREIVGGQMQQALKSHLEARKGAATQAFKELDNTAGANKVDVSGSVQAEAQKVIDQNKGYYDEHPELKPGKAWAILRDLAEKKTATSKVEVSPGVIDSAGNPITKTVTKPTANQTMSWTELHQLRSDLMDFYRNNPDIVKGRSEAWLQQMVSTIDRAMTSSAAGLSPTDLQKFRTANGLWESVKNTYDNPQSPYYHAVRAQAPSQVPGMLSKGTPELARSVRDTLGSLEGPFQRQFVENILNAKDGQTLDLKNLNSRLSRIPQDHLVAMIGEEGARKLRLLGKVAQKVTADSNPSGTAKVGVPTGEVVNLFSNPVAGAAELGAQYGTAKAINSPRFVDYLTRPKKP